MERILHEAIYKKKEMEGKGEQRGGGEVKKDGEIARIEIEKIERKWKKRTVRK